MRADGLYEVETTVGAVRASWVVDSACGVEPTFPSPRCPRAVLSGTGLRVEASGPTFDEDVATLFDPLDERSFAYLLPLSPTEALRHHEERVAELEKNRDALLSSMMSMAPEALDALTPEERHQAYKMLKLRVAVYPDGSLEVSGAFGEVPNVCTRETVQERCSA